jgi:hypothetical protein
MAVTRVRTLAVATLAIAAFVSLFLLLRRVPDVAPQSDPALIDLGTLNVLRGYQAVGPYSRFGWSHPGPLYFQLLAPGYSLSGERHLGTVTGVALLNVISLIVAMAIVWRHASSRWLLPVSIAVGAIYVGRLPGVLASTWNPHCILLPLVALQLATAAVVAGRIRWLPAVVVLGSFAVQTHIGCAALVFTCLAFALAAAILALRRGATAARSAVLAAVALGAIVWAAPVIEEIRPGGRHNLRDIVAFFAGQAPADPRGAARGFAYLATAPFSPGLTLDWGTDWNPLAAGYRRLMLVEGGLLVLAAAMAWRRRQRLEAALAALALASAATGLVAVRRLPEPMHDYTILWVSTIGVVAWCVIGGVGLDAILRAIARRDRPRAMLLRRLVVAVAVAALVVAASREVVARYQLVRTTSDQVIALANGAAAYLARAGVTDPLVHVPGDLWGTTAGVVLELARRGLEPKIESAWVSMFGDRLQPRGSETRGLRLASTAESENDYRYRMNYVLLGDAQGLSLYAEEAPPPFVVVDRAPDRRESTAFSAQELARLFDGRWAAGQDSSAADVVFRGPQTVTFSLPARAVGLRLWGQEYREWRLECDDGAGTRRPLGQVRIASGRGTEMAEVFPRGLTSCPSLAVTSLDAQVTWLSEIQILQGRE